MPITTKVLCPTFKVTLGPVVTTTTVDLSDFYIMAGTLELGLMDVSGSMVGGSGGKRVSVDVFGGRGGSCIRVRNVVYRRYRTRMARTLTGVKLAIGTSRGTGGTCVRDKSTRSSGVGTTVRDTKCGCVGAMEWFGVRYGTGNHHKMGTPQQLLCVCSDFFFWGIL